jgi:hypothetical protein
MPPRKSQQPKSQHLQIRHQKNQQQKLPQRLPQRLRQKLPLIMLMLRILEMQENQKLQKVRISHFSDLDEANT